MEFATGAAIAGATAAAAYLDARYHVRKDLANIRESRQLGKAVQRRVQQDRLSAWYLFEDSAKRLEDRECLWYRPQPSDKAVTYTWTQTYQNCCRFANFMLQNGVQPGEMVSVYLINSPEFVFNVLGSWAVGCAPAMINYNLSGEGLVHCLKVAKSKALIVDDDKECLQRIEESRFRIENELGMKILILDQATRAAILAMDPTRPDDKYRKGLNPGSPLFLFYTSGTTGFPKACPFPLAATASLGISRQRTCDLADMDTWYEPMPMYHGTGCTSMIGCMVNGGRLAIGRRFSVRNFWQDIHDSEANCFVYVGETARYLLAAPPSPLDKNHKLKAMYGNGLRPDIWRKFMDRFNIPMVNEFFNSTEGMLSLLAVCRSSFHDGTVGHHGAIRRFTYRNHYVPVEIDYENGDRIWRDPQTGLARRKSFEEGGEIIVRCNSQADFVGYWNNADATNKRFERDVFQKGDLWYRTGDALRRDRDGRWYFMDRLGDTFRWKSENVSTAEVAEVLGRFSGVLESNVYGVEVPSHDGRAGCAAIYIRPEERKFFDWSGLLAHTRKGLPRYAVPVFLRLVQTPAPMHNNKQNKVPLRKEGIDPKNVVEGSAGKNDEFMWVPPGGDRYIPFKEADWESIVGGKARL